MDLKLFYGPFWWFFRHKTRAGHGPSFCNFHKTNVTMYVPILHVRVSPLFEKTMLSLSGSYWNSEKEMRRHYSPLELSNQPHVNYKTNENECQEKVLRGQWTLTKREFPPVIKNIFSLLGSGYFYNESGINIPPVLLSRLYIWKIGSSLIRGASSFSASPLLLWESQKTKT